MAPLLFITALAGPTENDYRPCTSLYSVASCCAADVLGLLAVDCIRKSRMPMVVDRHPKVPLLTFQASGRPTSVDDFKSTCGASGKLPACCVIPVVSL